MARKPKRSTVDLSQVSEQDIQPKKRHTVRSVVIIVALVLVALAFIAAIGGGESIRPSSEPFDPANYQQVDYATVAKNPESYQDQNLVFSGEVIQVVENSGETDLRLATNPDGYNDVVFVRLDPSILGGDHIVENQTIAVYGRCSGQETYTSTFGQQISIPGMIADHIDENAQSQKDVQNQKIQALFDNVDFQKHDEGYGSYTYSATVQNTTDTDYDNISLILGLYDSNGTRLGETYASANSWKAGESSVFSAPSTTNATQVRAEVQSYSIDDQYYGTDAS